jgi:hypothetical protein
MVTREQARQQAAYQEHLTERRALYANSADTGFMPPEYGYAPLRPSARSRLFA